MNFPTLFQFLKDLNQNNNKDWMDSHRDRYTAVRNAFISWVGELDAELQKIDAGYTPINPRGAINRINNNLMYHPNKPIYKDNFGVSMIQEKKKSEFYLHFGLSGSFIAAGFYRPPSEILHSLRAGIDYNGEVLKEIINHKTFKKRFGELEEVDMLKNSPRDYPIDHPHIDLLRHKSFAVTSPLSEEQIYADDFMDYVLQVYKGVLPFREYLNKAATV